MATHFPSLSKICDENFNVEVFIEDLQLGIMPIGGETHHENFTVEIDGPDKGCESVKRLINEFGRDNRYGSDKSICSAIEQIAWNLSTEGSTAYEIILDDQKSIHLRSFTTRRTCRLFGYFLQLIPRADRNLWEKKVAMVPIDRVWYIQVPPSLGGRKHYVKMMKRLSKFSNLGPKFWRKDLVNKLDSSSFSYQLYQNQLEVYWLRATKTWGWNRRDSSPERTTDFFKNYKLICFSWAQAALREHIVFELNQLFGRLGIECKLKIHGLPTTTSIDQVKKDYMAGDVQTDEIYKLVKL